MTRINSFIVRPSAAQQLFALLLLMELSQDAGFAEQVANGIGSLRSGLQPFQRFLFIDIHLSRLCNRVISADLFDKAAVTRRTGIGYYDAVERRLMRTHTFQTNSYC